MSILVDWQIAELCESSNLIEPFNPKLVNPASLDLRIGETVCAVEIDQPYSIAHHTEEDPFTMAPGECILVASLETINLPGDIAAQFLLKSSRAREGYGHTMSGWCDPGWNGSKLTIELHNLSAREIPIYPGLKIGQLVFHKLECSPMLSYDVVGRYNNDQTVMGSRG